jgi:hypothetical protein
MTSTRRFGLAIAVSALALISATTACSGPVGHPAATGSPATPSTSPAATHPQVGGSPRATPTESSNLVTQSDAEALLGGFLIACVPAPAGSTAGPSCTPGCEGPATYPLAGQDMPLPCAKLERARIYDVNGHYCADDWHVVSSQLVGPKADLEKYQPQQSIDGVLLQTTRSPVRLLDAAYSQRYYGNGQFYYIQIGVVLPPQRISAGKHSLRQFAKGGLLGSFDRQIPFTIDPSGTGACADS